VPAVALGTYVSKNVGEMKEAVKFAVKNGYRHIDCAMAYKNEFEIGEALKELFEEGVIKREDIFITSKLANNYHRKEHVEEAINKTLFDLGLDYIDLYLIHWPVAFHYAPFDPKVKGFTEEYDPGLTKVDLKKLGGSIIDTSASLRDTYEAMEELVIKKKTKSIGLSNFNVALTHEILTFAKIKPVCNQVEGHIYLQQKNLFKYLLSKDIAVVTYANLGAGGGYTDIKHPNLLEDATVKEIALKKKKSPGQICLKFLLQKGLGILPKSVNPNRIKENHDLGFELTEQEMNQLVQLDRNHRINNPSDTFRTFIPIFD